MRSIAPALLSIFRSRLQADILAALLLDPGREYSLTDLAARLRAPLSTIHDEAHRLTTAGLLTRAAYVVVGTSACRRRGIHRPARRG
jgi:hypothetical protein